MVGLIDMDGAEERIIKRNANAYVRAVQELIRLLARGKERVREWGSWLNNMLH